ncbi:Uncharacterized protein TCM_008174 [Theobroma cacao]|uniref:Uncharacterized protein n=1 Tax=Theobroma cacao TaxID=3641 RepID=A0A061E4C9_THECC|nr:Uncharacterized protein TCM_008174 [Theobroma cacao]
MLCQVNELENFKRTCFGHMMDVEADKSLFCASLVHNLMLRRINEPDATEAELWFAIGKMKACFSKREFCLVTGLKFGPLLAFIVNPYEALPRGIHLRYWGLEKETICGSMVVVVGQEHRRVECIPMGHILVEFGRGLLAEGFRTSCCYRSRQEALPLIRIHMSISAIPKIRSLFERQRQSGQVWPRMLKWQCDERPTSFHAIIVRLEKEGKLWAVKTLEPMAEEMLTAY